MTRHAPSAMTLRPANVNSHHIPSRLARETERRSPTGIARERETSADDADALPT